MQKFLLYLLTSSVLGYAISMGGSALAEDVSKTESSLQVSDPNYISQMTSVSQLSDVQPGDWAFQAIQSLIERYGCIGGYPDGRFRGNRTLTRFEFAAALSACLDRVNELISSATADQVTKQDIANIERLQKQFGPELETFKRRVDTLEAKTTRLEATQFSTTTKLQGQVVAVISDISAKKVVETTTKDTNATLGARTRLELVTSFTGKDTLFTRLQSNNIRTPNVGTTEAGLYFGGGNNTALSVTALSYKFPIGDKTQVIAVANDGAAEDLTSTITSFNGDGAFGALSTFGTRNPIYSQLGASGLGINHEFNKNVTLSLGYLGGSMDPSSTAASPASGNGLFKGPYGALAQLTVKPSERVTLGLTYINSYNLPLATGSHNATFTGNSSNKLPQLTSGNFNGNFSSNSYGLQASLGVTPQLRVEGWAGYTKSQVLTGTRGDVDIWNYAVNLAFPDLWKKGNLGGLIVGMQPKVTSTTLSDPTGINLKDTNTSLHLEGFYQFKVNDNITITPGLIWLTAPNHNKQNDSVIIGALRTTFSF
jgi:hypothetical protein